MKKACLCVWRCLPQEKRRISPLSRLALSPGPRSPLEQLADSERGEEENGRSWPALTGVAVTLFVVLAMSS